MGRFRYAFLAHSEYYEQMWVTFLDSPEGYIKLLNGTLGAHSYRR